MVFSEEDARTTVITTILYPSQEARDAALGTGMNEGAAKSYVRLAEYLTTIALDG